MKTRSQEPSHRSADGTPSGRSLHVLTCGSVGGGKSALLDRLLADAGLVAENPPASRQRPSARRTGTGIEPDHALLFDGLLDERARGTTSDVAWRSFQTERRHYRMADAPGAGQNTRNLVMCASRCELALVLVDAQRGPEQTIRNQAAIVRFMGLDKVIVAINKMDLASWDEHTFLRRQREFLEFSRPLGFREPVFIPVCALHGDNVVRPGASMPWYRGPSLLDSLEAVEAPADQVVSGADSVITDRLEANVVWMGGEPLLPGRRYELRAGSATVTATVKRLIHRFNPETLASEPATRLASDDIGRCEVMIERAIECDLYSAYGSKGSFVLRDRLSQASLAAGMVTANQARQVFWQPVAVDKAARAAAKGQRPRVVWFTGLSGAGKSTLASAVEHALFREGLHTYMIT